MYMYKLTLGCEHRRETLRLSVRTKSYAVIPEGSAKTTTTIHRKPQLKINQHACSVGSRMTKSIIKTALSQNNSYLFHFKIKFKGSLMYLVTKIAEPLRQSGLSWDFRGIVFMRRRKYRDTIYTQRLI